MDMVKIHGGIFAMGSPDTDENMKPDETQHLVIVSGFYMSKYEITQKQYEDVMMYNPSKSQEVNHPVEEVSWYDVAEFCNKLSKREWFEQVYTITDIKRDGNNIVGATVTADWTKNGYRLPTEAEWEYACRAGTTMPFNTGNDIATNQANFDRAHGNPPGPTPVANFAPNAWGLYDMHGNVWEWCWDKYDKDYYSGSQAADPNGSANGDYRVRRGGSWGSSGQSLRSACRNYYYPDGRDGVIGFRVVRRP